MGDDDKDGGGRRRLGSSSDHDHAAPEEEPREDVAPWPGRRTLVGRIYRDALAAPRRAGRPGAFTLVEVARTRPGAPLPAALRERLGAKVGADLGAVRIHTDEAAGDAAAALDARAFTFGQEIYFGAGHYDPESVAGQSLLLHEVVHTVQDGGRSQGPLEVSQPGDAHEREAEQIAGDWAAAPGLPTPVMAAPAAAGLHRSPLGSAPVESPRAPAADSAAPAGGVAPAPPADEAPATEAAASDDAAAAAYTVSEPAAATPDATHPVDLEAGAAPAPAPAAAMTPTLPASASSTGEADAGLDDAAAAAPAHPLLALLARERLLTLAHAEATAGRAAGDAATDRFAAARAALQAEAEVQRGLVAQELDAGRRGFEVVLATQRRELLRAAQADSLRVRQHAHAEAERVTAAAALQLPAIHAAALAAAQTVSVPEQLRPEVSATVVASAEKVAHELAARAESLRARIRQGAARVADAIQTSARRVVARLDARQAEVARSWAEARGLALARITEREQQGLRALHTLASAPGAAGPAAGAGGGAGAARGRARSVVAEMLRAEADLAGRLGPPTEPADQAAPAPDVVAAITAYGVRARRVVDGAPATAQPRGGDLAGEVSAWMAQQGQLVRTALRETAAETTQTALTSTNTEFTRVRTRWSSDAEHAIAATSRDVDAAVTTVSAKTSGLGSRFPDLATRAAAELQRTQGDRIWAAVRKSLQTNLLYFALAGLAIAGTAGLLNLSMIATGLAAFTLAATWIGLSLLGFVFIRALRHRFGSLMHMQGFRDMPWYEKALRGTGAVLAAAGDATMTAPAAEAATGRDLVTGRHLTPEERAGLGTDVLLGILGALLGHAVHKRMAKLETKPGIRPAKPVQVREPYPELEVVRTNNAQPPAQTSSAQGGGAERAPTSVDAAGGSSSSRVGEGSEVAEPGSAPQVVGTVPARGVPPPHAQAVLEKVRAGGGNAPTGYKGGIQFKNDGRGGGTVLPRADAEGQPISYREYDVNPYQKGVNRGAERLVIGSDGRAYFTADHYRTFILVP
ncbi:MAG: DUF4157 domain-containing protein [Deltaproteobacteria bacterium]|nr:DUF4157 domain-containing protein [Deltaproteobacteria bacterium]